MSDTVRKSAPDTVQSFNQQVPVSQDVYKLVFSNSSTTTSTNSTNKLGGTGSKISINKALQPPTDNGILNSVENFQAIQSRIPNPQQRAQEEKSVLQQPLMGGKSSSSTTTTTESGKSSRKDDKQAAPILQAPTVKPLSSATTKKLPNGVAPIPETSLLESNSAVIDEPVEQSVKEDVKNDLMVENDQENLAHEVPDTDFNIDDKKVQQHDNMANDNNAEEDNNQYVNENRPMFGGNIKEANNNHNKLNEEKLLRNEVMDDQGRENENYGDLQLGDLHEDDADTDEYGDVKLLKAQGLAERN